MNAVRLKLALEVYPGHHLPDSLNKNDVVVVSASLRADDELIVAAKDVLSVEEYSKYVTLANDAVARRFVMTRFVTRVLLGDATGCAARDIALRTTPRGKPEMLFDCPENHVWFNIAHTEDVLLVALSRRAPVGVDVERVRVLKNSMAIARRVLPAGEVEDMLLEAATEREAGRAFFRRWCGLEARLKMSGQGLAAVDNGESVQRRPTGAMQWLDSFPLPQDLAAAAITYQAAVSLDIPSS